MEVVAEPRARSRSIRSDFDSHEWGVLLPLALVGFFSNYDTGLLTLAAPDIADGLGVEVATFGIGVAIIRLAALGSVGTLRLADRWGRRTVLLLSVIGFTLATGLTAAAWGFVAFVAFQFVSRVFLATEETLSGVVLTEELRPDRRGSGIGLLGILATFGFGVVAVVQLFAESTPLGWRLFYVVALVPLFVVAYLRRNLRETRAFGVAAAEERLQTSWWPRLAAHDRGTLWRLAVLLGAIGMLNTSAFFYAAELADDQYGWEGIFTIIVIAAGPTTFLGYALGGRLSDRLGRKPVAVAATLLAAAGAVVLFTEQPLLFAPGFFLMAGADAAIAAAVRAAYVCELFPTEVRATAASFIGFVYVAAGSLGLAAVGVLAAPGWLDASVTVVVIAAVCGASVLVLRPLPETAGADVI